jgi:hypothetical protein
MAKPSSQVLGKSGVPEPILVRSRESPSSTGAKFTSEFVRTSDADHQVNH